jgi:hypothetical protein
MFQFLSGKIKKTPPNSVSQNRYKFISLDEAEPDLGVAPANNSILASNTSGGRYWLTANNGVVVNNNILSVNTSGVIVNTSSFITTSNTNLQQVLADLDQNIGNDSQIFIITKNLTITSDWQDVGISGTDLESGSYFVQMFANDFGAGGDNINQYYTGTMSWFSGSTTEPEIELPNDEIVLHRAGGGGDAGMYLRTMRSNLLKLQVYSNYANAGAANYVFKFKKIF